MARSISSRIINIFIFIIFIPLLYWAWVKSDSKLTYTHQIIKLGNKLFQNHSIQTHQYPLLLREKKIQDTRGTQTLVKVSSLGYKYFHTQELFYENWQTLKPGQTLSLLTIADPDSKQLQQIQYKYFQNNYGMSIKQQKNLCVIVTSYNNQDSNLYEKNLKSIFLQNYKKYKVIYIDDASTDKTFTLAKNYVIQNKYEDKFIFEKNQKNQGSTWNHFHYINKHCDKKDVVVSIDGDDKLIGSHVFTMVNQIYRNNKVWVSTSQSFANKENNIWISHFPREGIKTQDVRKYFYGHLKTFLAGLFMKIRQQSFKNPKTNQFFKIANDRAIIYPLIEMAGNEHYLYLPEIFYFYNDTTSNNNHIIRKEKQLEAQRIIKGLPHYIQVPSPF